MTNGIDDLNFDEVLDIEQQYYQKGFDEAFSVGEEHSYKDGKQFGIQTGFQRFILIGALKRVCGLLEQAVQNDNNKESVGKHIAALSDVLHNLNKFYSENSKTISATNSAQDVELYEDLIKRIRSKAKVVFTKLGYKTLYPELENTCKLISGEVPSTQINSVEKDMW